MTERDRYELQARELYQLLEFFESRMQEEGYFLTTELLHEGSEWVWHGTRRVLWARLSFMEKPLPWREVWKGYPYVLADMALKLADLRENAGRKMVSASSRLTTGVQDLKGVLALMAEPPEEYEDEA
jgi:hypothetical protein